MPHISLGDLQCDFFELTDVHGGETSRRFPVAPGDILLGDVATPTRVEFSMSSKPVETLW
jgi:hypothetical protein